MTTIETRLADLEKANRRYRRIITAIVALASIGMITAFTRNQIQDKVQAKTFEVLDNNNRVLVSMGAGDGGGRVTTYNAQGNKQVDMLPNNAGGGAFIVYDGKGSMNARITYTEGGGAGRQGAEMALIRIRRSACR